MLNAELPYLPPVKQKILEFIKKYPRSDSERIIRAVWANDSNGGPCSNIISAHVCVMNKNLKKFNYQIKSSGGPGSVYWLEKLPK